VEKWRFRNFLGFCQGWAIQLEVKGVISDFYVISANLEVFAEKVRNF